MKLKRITINKYKSITSPLTIEETGILHIFIGVNNAGKTNILDSIYQLYNSDSRRLHDPECDIKATFSLHSKQANTLEVRQKQNQVFFLLDGKKIAVDRGKKLLSHHIIRICATNPLKINRVRKDFESFYTEHEKLFRVFHKILAQYIPQIKVNHELFKVHTVEHEGISRPFERLGAGFQQVFKILMYLFHPQYTILLLEEPEIHLHPALVTKLITILEQKNLDNQIFLTTHSTKFIHPDNLHRVFRVTKKNNSTTVYSPRLVGKRLNYQRLRQELNADNTEMFFADKVLLVEGPSDHVLMRSLINNFYKGTKDIKVIQVYGKSNIDVYTSILDVFNIPYCVLLDRDALYDTGLKLIQSRTRMKFTEPEVSLIKTLKKYNIFILPNGSIERNYPRKYQRRQKHKTQNAMYAASRITRNDYNSQKMRYLKEVIDSL